MADLIDRNALLNDLKESVKAAIEWKEEARDEEIKIRAEQAHGTFIECALRVKNAPAVNRWIPCSERLPEENVRCLVYTEGGGYGISRRMDRNLEKWNCFGLQVTHWMLLPEPPEKE